MFDARYAGKYNQQVMGQEWAFDLQLEHTEDGYRAAVTQSPAGTAVAPFALPYKPREQTAILQRLAADPGADEGHRADQFALARQVGGRLFATAFPPPILVLWEESWRRAYDQRATLRLRLSLGDALELHVLPWEYLYDDSRDEFLALSVHTPLVRYQPRSRQILPYPVVPPLRVLVVLAGPDGYPPLAVGREWRELLDTIDHLAADDRMVFERLPKPTLLDLQRRLRQHEYHILHFVGFSIYDPQTQEGVLMLEDEVGRGRAVSGQHLGKLLSDDFSLRLAVLSVRNAVRMTGLEPGAAVADNLVRHGLPAAVLQPTRLWNRPSLAFVHELYTALAAFEPVDVAIAHARRAIQLEEVGAGWGVPQLVTRLGSGNLFERKATPPQPATVKPRLNLRSVLTRSRAG